MFRVNDAPEWPEWLAEWCMSEIMYREQRGILAPAFWVAMDDVFDPVYVNWKHQDGKIDVDAMYMPHQATVDKGITGMCDETGGAWEDFFGAAIRFTLGQDGQIVMREAAGASRVEDAMRMISGCTHTSTPPLTGLNLLKGLWRGSHRPSPRPSTLQQEAERQPGVTRLPSRESYLHTFKPISASRSG